MNKPTQAMHSSGFTLIELLLVVIIIGIFAAMALPSYREQIKRNNIAKTQSEMMMVGSDLERWRAKALTYAGYSPTERTLTKMILSTNDTRISSKYTLYLSTSQDNKPVDLSTAKLAGDWMMLALPKETGYPILGLTSTGIKCQSLDKSINLTKFAVNGYSCGTGDKSW